MAVRRCGCGKSIPDNTTDLEAHKAICPQGLQKLDSAVSRRPDLEFWAKSLGLWIVVDVSLVAVIGRSAVRDANAELEHLLGARNNTKQDLYKLQVESREQAIFLVASATANGTLSSETKLICRIIADNSNLYNDSYQRVCDELIYVVQEASAQALLNAERRLLLLPPRQAQHPSPARLSAPIQVQIPSDSELASVIPAPRPSSRPSQVLQEQRCRACNVTPTSANCGEWCLECAKSKGLICHSCVGFSNSTSDCPQCSRRFCPQCIDTSLSLCFICAPTQREIRRSCSLDSTTRELIYPSTAP
ncbi:MAG: hypothetical protein Q7T55_01145, partial [Solirubrobacteraceae bacterium]|nr:hypothetical protein [Solirubrobacteraceae bacterium]